MVVKNKDTRGSVKEEILSKYGYCKKVKTPIFHDTATVRQRFEKIFVALACTRKSCIFFAGIIKAFPQITRKLVRDFFLIPSLELKMKDNNPLLLKKPRYGLADGGDY